MFDLILAVGGIAAFIYLFNRQLAVESKLKEVQRKADEAADFEDTIVSIIGEDEKKVLSNLASFLLLKDKHRTELIYKSIFDREKSDQIDWEALHERQKKEFGELFHKLREESKVKDPYVPSFPAK